MTPLDQRLSKLFAELQQTPDGPMPKRKIAIISTARSGSKYFCESLASSGRFGRPLEWMNSLYVQAFVRLRGVQDLPLDQYLQIILARTTSPNGVFSINFHVDQHMYWRERNADLLQIGFDRVYYVFRKDKLAQALSLAKAVRSGRWRSSDRAVRETEAAEIPNSEILNVLHGLSLQEEYYKAHLAKHVGREFCYEDFSASDTYFREVLADNGIEHRDISQFRSQLTIQRGSGDAQRVRDLMLYLGRQ